MNFKFNQAFSLLLVVFSIGASFGQKGAQPPTVTLSTDIIHNSCTSSNSQVNYTINVSTGWPPGSSVNNLVLKNSQNIQVYSHTGSSNPSGVILALSPDRYTFTGSLTVKNTLGNWISVNITQSIWVGIQTTWKEMIDMFADPNSFSAKRYQEVQTYGAALSSNYCPAGDFWIQSKAQYGTSTDSHIFMVVGSNSDLTFNPNDPLEYLEFYKTSSSSGVRVKYNTGSGFAMSTISTSPTDIIRLVRNGNKLSIQKGDSYATVFNFVVNYTGPMNIKIFTKKSGDNAVDVVSTLTCANEGTYFNLKESIEQSIAYINSSALRFKFVDSYYDNSQLTYKVTDLSKENSSTAIQSGILNQDDHINWFEIPIGQGGLSLTNGKTYILEVSDSKGRKSYLKFTL